MTVYYIATKSIRRLCLIISIKGIKSYTIKILSSRYQTWCPKFVTIYVDTKIVPCILMRNSVHSTVIN